jgi:hypothetical protein
MGGIKGGSLGAKRLLVNLYADIGSKLGNYAIFIFFYEMPARFFVNQGGSDAIASAFPAFPIEAHQRCPGTKAQSPTDLCSCTPLGLSNLFEITEMRSSARC